MSALELAGVFVGVFLLFHGLTVLMHTVADVRGAFAGLIRGAVAAVIVVALVVGGILLIGGGDSADAAQDIEARNGHATAVTTLVATIAAAGAIAVALFQRRDI